MRKVWRLAVAAAAAVTSIVPRSEAAWLKVEAPVQVAPGWARIAGRYESPGVTPAFRAIARCGCGEADGQVLDALVHLAAAEGALWFDLPGTPDRLVPATMRCDAPAVSIEMLVDTRVVASTTVSPRQVTPNPMPAASIAPPAAAGRADRRLRVKSQKYGAPSGKRTEAGLEWLLGSRVSIQLNYERTAQPPMMPFDHDDGILTRLQFGF